MHSAVGLTATNSPPCSIHLALSICLPLSSTSRVMMEHMHCWQYLLSDPVFPSSHYFSCPGVLTCALIDTFNSDESIVCPKIDLPHLYDTAAPSVPFHTVPPTDSPSLDLAGCHQCIARSSYSLWLQPHLALNRPASAQNSACVTFHGHLPIQAKHPQHSPRYFENTNFESLH